MQYSRLISKFEKWRKSSNNVMKKEGLLEQIELFQFMEDEEEINTDVFVEELLRADKKYTRLMKRGVSHEFVQENW